MIKVHNHYLSIALIIYIRSRSTRGYIQQYEIRILNRLCFNIFTGIIDLFKLKTTYLLVCRLMNDTE